MVTNVAQQKHNNNNYYISAFSYKNIDKDYHIKKKKKLFLFNVWFPWHMYIQ